MPTVLGILDIYPPRRPRRSAPALLLRISKTRGAGTTPIVAPARLDQVWLPDRAG